MLFAENVHNSIETWPRLRLLPLCRHSSREYFMCHHLPVMESKAQVMSVSCPGEPLQQRRESLRQWICALIKVLLPEGPDLCSLDIACGTLPGRHHWQNIEFEPFELVLISMTNLMMNSVVDLNSFSSIRHVTERSHNRPFQP
ncbi:hypothetical protein F2P81_002359 [Scophthalmus maximus]|uniref:Uncharacterized protein n=1 Tax=Scophthalmus maximus TaxID=52904 RepID=A0A6A4TQG9_SCOMX|nr:hypothetical protein F2P81_002359 [Scophthalmus maximus]